MRAERPGGCLIAFLLALCLGLLCTAAVAGTPVIHTLQEATLDTATGRKPVGLPHILPLSDFPQNGGTVRYHLHWQLDQVPEQMQAVYVSKMALSGRLYVNGQLVGSCGNGPLERLRCLHQPQLLRVPPVLLQTGLNTLEFEIYATARQTNGLSAVQVGDADALYTQFYAWKKFLTFDLQIGLVWLSMFLGLLSLTVGHILRSESVFTWFGLTSLVNAIACVNSFVVHPRIDIDVYNWMIFTFRLWSVPLLFMTMLAVFAKDDRRLTYAVGIYCVITSLLIWFSETHRMVVFALATPLVLAFPVLGFLALRWSWKSLRPLQAASTLIVLVLFIGALFDWIRLYGKASLEGVYPSAYLYSAILIALGLLLLSRLASALLLSQKTSALLERQVAERTAYEVTENIPVGTYTMVLEPGASMARFSFMSRRFLELTGLDRKTAASDPWKAFACVHPEDLDEWVRLNAEAFAAKRRFFAQTRVIVQGAVRWMTAESVPRDLPDGTTVWEGVLIDVTEQMLAREAAERDQAALQAHLLEQSRLQEREQLLRDMHDGFGSQIASLRMMVEKGRISPSALARFLQEVSADLHLVVDTLGQPNITLEEAIYDKRYRIERRFAGSGIQFHWELHLDGMPALSARTILQILRIVQEAMHNAIRHAEPKNIVLTADYQELEDQVLIRIRDDGPGMPEQPTQGRGLANMRHRAREIGAQWQIITGPTGTAIELRYPLSAAAAHRLKAGRDPGPC